MFIPPEATRVLEPISYRGALLRTLLYATVYMVLHSLLKVLAQIANKMGFKKNVYSRLYGVNPEITDQASPT
jgi:hypothetical protein